jgi:hypothetical protein
MNIVENKDGVYDLLGIPECGVLPAEPGDIIVIHVDNDNTEEQMFHYGKKVRALVPDQKVLVLPKSVNISVFPDNWYKDGPQIATVSNSAPPPASQIV